MNIYNQRSRDLKLATHIYVMRSILTRRNTDEELIQCLKNDSSISVKEIGGNDIEVTWVPNHITTRGFSAVNCAFLPSLDHGEWKELPRAIRLQLKNEARKDMLDFQLISFSMVSLSPYMAVSHYVHGKSVTKQSRVLTWSGVQHALSIGYCNGSIPHGKAVEGMLTVLFHTTESNGRIVCVKSPRLLQNIQQDGYLSASKKLPPCKLGFSRHYVHLDSRPIYIQVGRLFIYK